VGGAGKKKLTEFLNRRTPRTWAAGKKPEGGNKTPTRIASKAKGSKRREKITNIKKEMQPIGAGRPCQKKKIGQKTRTC